MAVGDILSVTVNPDGWSADVTIDGFVEGASYDFGLGATNDPTGAKFRMTVVSEGYDSSGSLTTKTRTVYGTKVIRLPYPDNASLDEDDSSGDLVVRVALSEFVYNDDKNGGAGTSGTDPTVDIDSGWATNTGGSSETSNAASDLTVTNSSTLDYPLPVAQWDHLANERHKDDFRLACNAFHRLGVAAVRFDAVGDSSAHSQNATVSAPTLRQRPITQLYAPAYETTIPLSGYTQGEPISCRFRVYPAVGDADAILDTDDLSGSQEILGYTPIKAYCDKSDAVDVFAVVDTGGNDSTGVASSTLSTAEANPYASIGKALEGGANVVYLNAGTFGAVGVQPSTGLSDLGYWRIVTYHPSVSRSSVVIQVNTVRNYRCPRLKYLNLNVQLYDGSSWLDGEAQPRKVCFATCTFDPNGISTPTTNVGYRSDGVWFLDCDGDLNGRDWSLTSFSTARVAFSFDGCDLPSPGDGLSSQISPVYRVVACTYSGGVFFGEKPATNPSPEVDGSIHAFCRGYDCDYTGHPVIKFGNTVAVTRGVAVIGNVIERTTTTNPGIQIGADSSVLECSNVILWHNTVAGERCNLGYNDTGSAAYTRNNWSLRFNAFRDFNTKHDLFGTPNGNRIGGWPVLYAVGFWGNRYETTTFQGEFDGIDTVVVGDDGIAYVDNASYTGDGTGFGDYTPDTGSVLLDRVPSGGRVLLWDLDGNAIPDDGTGEAGAIQVGGGTPVSSTVTTSIEALGAVASTIATSIEAAGVISAERDTAIESLSSVAVERDTSIEATQAVSAERASAVEGLATVSAERTTAVESLAPVSAERTSSLEALQGVSATMTTSWESLASAGTLLSETFETVGGDGYDDPDWVESGTPTADTFVDPNATPPQPAPAFVGSESLRVKGAVGEGPITTENVFSASELDEGYLALNFYISNPDTSNSDLRLRLGALESISLFFVAAEVLVGRYVGGSLVTTNGFAYTQGQWNLLEIHWDKTGGSIQAKLNGALVFDESETLDRGIDRIRFGPNGSVSNSFDFYFDNVRISTADWIGGEFEVSSPSRATSYESLTSVATEEESAVEALATVLSEVATAQETVAQIAQGRDTSVEALAAIVREVVTGYEAVEAAAEVASNAGPTCWESIGVVSATRTTGYEGWGKIISLLHRVELVLERKHKVEATLSRVHRLDLKM